MAGDATPIQLVYDANADNPDDHPRLVVNTKNLDILLRAVGNRPVSVFTIVGPQKTGKSLLFGFMVKCLIAAENDEVEWIDWKNKTQPLEELSWSQNGNSPEQSGIWCYNRPFILEDDSQKGKEVAVLLAYTQSTKSCQWTADKTSTALAGLSIFVSSCTIFNVTKQLDEHCILSLSQCIANALLAVGKCEGQQLQPQAPFQKAMMLIRDWSFPADYAYGFSGGKEYVQGERLQPQLRQPSITRASVQVISSCFENISACLLPFPGNDAIKPNFKGSIQEMDTYFVECLRDFINDVIDVDKLLLKRNSVGSTVSGAEWKALIEKYVDAVNTNIQEKVHPAKILQDIGVKATFLSGEEKGHMKIALQVYAKYWDKKVSKDAEKTLSEKELAKIHSSASKRATKALKNEMLPNGEEDADSNLKRVYRKAEQTFKNCLGARFNANLAERNTAKLASLEKLKTELVAQYNIRILETYPLDSKPPSEKLVRNESSANIEGLKQQFREKAGENMNASTEKVFIALCQELALAEEKTLAKIFHKDEPKGESAESFYKLIEPPIVIPVHPPSKFSLPSKPELSNSLTPDKVPSITPVQFEKSSGTKTLPSIDKNAVTRTSREKKRFEEERLKERAKELVESLKDEYIIGLNKHLSTDQLVDLEQYHTQQLVTIMETFEKKSPFETNTQAYNLYKDLLDDDLRLALSQAKTKQRQVSRSKQTENEKMVKNAIHNYEESLEQYLSEHRNISSDKMESRHRKFQNAELVNLEQHLSSKEYSKAKPQVEKETENIFQKLKSIHERGQNITANQSKQILNDLKAEHSNNLNRALNQALTETELKKAHESSKRKILAKFCKTTEASKGKVFMEEVEQDLNQQFLETQQKFQAKLKSEAGNTKISTHQAKQFYKEEMEKQLKTNDFLKEAELVRIHKKVSSDALKKCPPNLAANLLTEFQHSLEALFKMYEDENNMNMNVEPAIGIDLGTTFSCVAVYQKGQVKIIPNADGKFTTPSYVLFQTSGEEIVGGSAKERAYENPEGTIFYAKRILGRRFDDPKLQDDMKLWPFTVVDGGRGVPMIEVNGKKMNPEEISAKVLTQLKKDAEAYLKRPVTKAVITVPAYFTDGQKQATIDAGTMAGLEVLSILTEPVAAAMAYRLQYATGERKGSGERHILIFDLGGGTFDVAILKTNQGKIDVLTVDGDTHLGGEDFDKNLMDYCAAEFKKKEKVDLFEGKDSPKKNVRDNVRRTLKRLQAECERQKIALASAKSAIVNLDNIYQDKDLRITVTRTTFETINKALFENTIKVVQKSLAAANLKKEQIDDIVLVGGSTRIPKIQQLLREFFGKELDKKINPDEAVAHGAGLVAAIKKGNVAKDNAAYTRIQDVTPMPIGVEVYGGGFSPIIPKSTKIPVKLVERYKTAHNNQTSVQITIYEGEETIAVNNKHLGDFYLNGIPPKDAGVENIDVEMLINEQGILHVTASVSSTGTKSAVTVTENKQRMGQAAIKRYIADKASRGK